MIKRILVGLGGTPYTSAAIRQGVALAQSHGARLTAVSVVDPNRLTRVGSAPIGAGAAAKELGEHRLIVTRQRIDEAIAEFESACRASGVDHVVRLEEGDPFSLMISSARYHDLMIFGLRSIFEYGVLGETRYDPVRTLIRLIEAGVRPILAVAKEYRPIRRALIAYSGSMESARTMKRFVQSRPWPDLTMRVVTFAGGAEDAERLLADALDYCRAYGVEPESEAMTAPATQQLLERADAWQADLIVMGSSARRLLVQRILGETALRVIQSAPCSLFLGQ